MNGDLQNRLDGFASDFLQRSGDLREKSIQKWHLASDITASGVFASGIFWAIQIDGPTTSGYVLTTDANGWGTWQPAAGDHSLLSNLNWSSAGHIIDTNIVPNASGTQSVGTQAIAFSQVNTGTVRGDTGTITSLNVKQININDGNQSVKKALTSDVNGNGNWGYPRAVYAPD